MTPAAWVNVGRGKKVCGRAGTQLIEVRNKSLTTCDLESLLPLRYGAFYVQPGGLVPRARGRMTESMLEALASHAKSSSKGAWRQKEGSLRGGARPRQTRLRIYRLGWVLGELKI